VAAAATAAANAAAANAATAANAAAAAAAAATAATANARLGAGAAAAGTSDAAELEEAEPESEPPVNERALAVLRRVQAKLTGRDFDHDPIGHLMSRGTSTNAAVGPAASRGPLDTATQVERLILCAASLENLAVAYVGWCASW
jgi:FKBP12-rapamycin complex-associated protein